MYKGEAGITYTEDKGKRQQYAGDMFIRMLGE